MRIFIISLFCFPLLFSFSTNAVSYSIDVIADGLDHPWGMAFIGEDQYLVTERSGQLRHIKDGMLLPEAVKGVPDNIQSFGQGGLLDIVLHPQFVENGWVYFSYAAVEGKVAATVVARARWQNEEMRDWQVIYSGMPKTSSGRHFGSRLLFDDQGYLFITLGDRGDRESAQRLSDPSGSLLRLHDDGRVPEDNPFVDVDDVLPEIYSFGHRNAQGIAKNKRGEIWLHEHGPKGGDELNRVMKGANYGWPVITYGRNYGLGTKIGEGERKDGMEQPNYYWVPSIAPSGLAIYEAEAFPEWMGDYFVGSLKFQTLVRMQYTEGKFVEVERLFEREFGRLRDVKVGPDGYLYLLTDEDSGQLIRVSP